MKRLKSIPGKWMLTIMLALLLTTCYFVLNSRVYLLEQKEQLVQQEQKLIAQEEAGIPIRTQHVSPASVHVGAAYLWIIPFGILEVCFLILYTVRYLA